MVSQHDELRELVNNYTFRTINTDAPAWLACPVYRLYLGDDTKFAQVCEETPLSFDPRLLGILQAPDPPSISVFHDLAGPMPSGKFWGVYYQLMEKAGAQPKLYTGSGTNAEYGASVRLVQYEERKMLPRFVAKAFDEGYTITATGLFCWADLPPTEIVPSARLRFNALEAVFDMIFFTSHANVLDWIWDGIRPWSREDVEWLPLGSHSPLRERPAGDLDMSKEQLLAYEAERKKQIAVNSKRAEDAERAQDPAAYLARKLKEKLAWEAKNPDKVKETAAGVRQRAIASQKHPCTVCETSFPSVTALAKHMASDAHAEQVRLAAGGAPKSVSAATLRSREFAARNKASKKFLCKVCNKAFGLKGHLDRHDASKRHLRAVAKASA